MSPTYSTTPLYGGSITVQLPSEFCDASDLRDVPDHQEVFLNRENLDSIVFEIVERVEPPSHPCVTDDEAVNYHYQNITEDGYLRQDNGLCTEPQEETKQWIKENVKLEMLPQLPAISIVSSQHQTPSSSANQSDHSENKQQRPVFTAILMTLIRLQAQKTDILVTINVPHLLGEYSPEDIDIPQGKLGPLLEAAFEYRQKIWQTFKIEDWGLFVEE